MFLRKALWEKNWQESSIVGFLQSTSSSKAKVSHSGKYAYDYGQT